MTYICVRWHHQHPDEPVELFSELDDRRFEIRKVEVFRDGRMQFADATEQKVTATNSTSRSHKISVSIGL